MKYRKITHVLRIAVNPLQELNNAITHSSAPPPFLLARSWLRLLFAPGSFSSFLARASPIAPRSVSLALFVDSVPRNALFTQRESNTIEFGAGSGGIGW